MNYATTTYQIGKARIAKIPKTKATAPTVGRVHKMDATPKGRIGNQKGQKTATPAIDVANGFLKARFLPRLESDETVQTTPKTDKLERDFYKSLSQLCTYYGIEPMETRQYSYPYNIRLSVWDTQKQLRAKVVCFESLKIVSVGKRHFLETEERCNIAHTLYYIPLVPIYIALRRKCQRKAATLLLSVCSYLHRIVGIPHYRDEYSFLQWQYEMIDEWMASDEDTDGTEGYRQELCRALWVGEVMKNKIGNIGNLQYFGKRINSFICKTKSDMDCFRVAREAYALFSEYPDANCFRYAKPYEVYKEDDEYEVVTMDNIISFCAETDGVIFDTLTSSVNSQLGEYGDAEEPAITKRFDGNEVENRNLDFENRLFILLNDLAHLLYQF